MLAPQTSPAFELAFFYGSILEIMRVWLSFLIEQISEFCVG
jgi:hypothetical protein